MKNPEYNGCTTTSPVSKPIHDYITGRPRKFRGSSLQLFKPFSEDAHNVGYGNKRLVKIMPRPVPQSIPPIIADMNFS